MEFINNMMLLQFCLIVLYLASELKGIDGKECKENCNYNQFDDDDICHISIYYNGYLTGKSTNFNNTKGFRSGPSVKSIRNGKCCWKVYQRGKLKHSLTPHKELLSIFLRTPYRFKLVNCTINKKPRRFFSQPAKSDIESEIVVKTEHPKTTTSRVAITRKDSMVTKLPPSKTHKNAKTIDDLQNSFENSRENHTSASPNGTYLEVSSISTFDDTDGFTTNSTNSIVETLSDPKKNFNTKGSYVMIAGIILGSLTVLAISYYYICRKKINKDTLTDNEPNKVQNCDENTNVRLPLVKV